MIRYETLMLAHTQITDDELTLIERQFEKLTNDVKGALNSFDKWGKYRLAYPVKKNDYGIYILARFDAPKEVIGAMNKEIDTFFKIKCSDFVMRHVTMKLEDDAPSVYIKPDPIDTKGTSNVDSFIKENKMEGIISTKVETQTQDVKDVAADESGKVEQAEEEPAQTSVEAEQSSPQNSTQE